MTPTLDRVRSSKRECSSSIMSGGDNDCSIVVGRIQQFIGKWRELTHDPSILSAVSGYKIDFLIDPVQLQQPQSIKMSPSEVQNVDRQG